MACVYRHIRLDNGNPFYIGIGKNESRAYSKRGRNIFWQRIVSKCGYEVEILFYDLDYEQAKLKEQEFIYLYGRTDTCNGLLCNLTNGGDGSLGYKPTQEALLKIAKASKGRIKTKEQIDKWKKNMNFEKDEEFRERIRQSLIGRKHSPERVEKIRNSLKGKTLSEETKIKISKALKGRKAKPITEEHRSNLSISHTGKTGINSSNKKAIINIKQNGDVKEYYSISNASLETNISAVTLTKYALKKSTPKDKSIWEFKKK